MAEKYLVPSRGVNVSVRRVTSIKGNIRYKAWEVLDYSSGRRVRHQCRTLELAKAKAREIAEALAKGKQAVLGWDTLTIAAVRQALALLSADEIVPACQAWRAEHSASQLVPQRVAAAIVEFMQRRDGTISDRRLRTDRAYIGAFRQKFGTRWLHEIRTLEIKDWAAAKSWGAVTRNDVLQLLRTFYKDAIERGHACVNAADIKREKIGGSDIKIFTPDEAQRILSAVEDRLKAFSALQFFSGIRKEDLSRLTVEQVRAGMLSGSIFLEASLTKT
jgi:uncharacterized protein YyaL (SSP411 family)